MVAICLPQAAGQPSLSPQPSAWQQPGGAPWPSSLCVHPEHVAAPETGFSIKNKIHERSEFMLNLYWAPGFGDKDMIFAFTDFRVLA